MARIEQHLAMLSSDAARRCFLRQQIAAWERRYTKFVANGASEPVSDPNDPPQAADFVCTIMALAARKCAIAN
jgi:hypothetical protein